MKRLGILTTLVTVPIVGLAGLIAYGIYLEGQVEYWNKKIDELCAADGGRNVGLRVYERVMAPESYIRPASGAIPGSVAVPWRYKGKEPKANEPIILEMVELEVLNGHDPRVSKYAIRITRVTDEKVLAEQLKYMRAGGGIPMPDPSAVHTCPKPEKSTANTNAIFNEVFINHPLNTSKDRS